MSAQNRVELLTESEAEWNQAEPSWLGLVPLHIPTVNIQISLKICLKSVQTVKKQPKSFLKASNQHQLL